MAKNPSKIILVSLLLGMVIVAVTVIFIRSSPKPATTTATVDCQPSAPATTNPVVGISMGDDRYEPNEITITAGEAVSFINNSSKDRWPASNIHPTHELYPEFDPRCPVKSGESWTNVFDRAGEWRMHDHLSPFIKGKITVQ